MGDEFDADDSPTGRYTPPTGIVQEARDCIDGKGGSSSPFFAKTPEGFSPLRRKKPKKKARLPNMDAMLAQGASREHLETFLKMRGVSVLEVQEKIDLGIARYNARYPWRPYEVEDCE